MSNAVHLEQVLADEDGVADNDDFTVVPLQIPPAEADDDGGADPHPAKRKVRVRTKPSQAVAVAPPGILGHNVFLLQTGQLPRSWSRCYRPPRVTTGLRRRFPRKRSPTDGFWLRDSPLVSQRLGGGGEGVLRTFIGRREAMENVPRVLE